MAGLRWDPVSERFSTVWTWNHGEAARLSTPAVSPVGTLAVVRQSGSGGLVQFFDIFHDPAHPALVGEYELHDECVGTPAAIWMGDCTFLTS